MGEGRESVVHILLFLVQFFTWSQKSSRERFENLLFCVNLRKHLCCVKSGEPLFFCLHLFISICINSVQTLLADWKSRFTPRSSTSSYVLVSCWICARHLHLITYHNGVWGRLKISYIMCSFLIFFGWWSSCLMLAIHVFQNRVSFLKNNLISISAFFPRPVHMCSWYKVFPVGE